MNKTIHELNALVSLANDDELIVYDVATGTSKKIKKSDLKNQLAGDLIVDSVTDGDMHAVTSNAVFDNCVIKRDVTIQAPSTVEDDIKALGNELLSLVTSGTQTFSGLFFRLGATLGSYTLTVRYNASCINGYVVIDNEQANAGMYFITRVNNDWIIEKLVTSNAFSAELNLPAYNSIVVGGENHVLGTYTIPETGVYALDWYCFAINNTQGGTSMGIRIVNNTTSFTLAQTFMFVGATVWSNGFEVSCTRKLTKGDVISFYYDCANPSECAASTVAVTRIL